MAYLASRSFRGLNSCLKLHQEGCEDEVVGKIDCACYTECDRFKEQKGFGRRAAIAFLVNEVCYAVQLALSFCSNVFYSGQYGSQY